MDASTSNLRKVALVVASLSPEAADRLLDQLTPEMARHVRDMIMSLSPADLRDQSLAIREFMASREQVGGARLVAVGKTSRESASRPISPSVAGSVSVSQKSLPQKPTSRTDAASTTPMDRANERLIADCLSRELPQTIAVALASLPTERASEVISHLPAHLQSEVLERLVEYEPSQALELTEIREEFHLWLREQLEHALHRAELAERMATILESTHPGTRHRILQNLAGTDERLAQELQEQFHVEDAVVSIARAA